MYRWFKLSITLAIIASFFITDSALAIDNRCFTEKECIDERVKLNNTREEAALGFYQSAETSKACGGFNRTDANGNPGEKLGFCLPSGQTITNISFGGRNSFAHLGDFIQFAYQYGFVIGIIISTLVIIVAGFQWTVSGGNASTIQSAQKRISGAVVGLLLMAMSYTILNTVNPRTLSLRLPQIWMINPTELQPTYCGQNKKTVAFLKEQNETLSIAEVQKRMNSAVYKSQDEIPTKCGSRYLVEGSGDLTCRGSTCPMSGNQNQVCGPSNKNLTLDECYSGDIILSYIKHGPHVTEAWNDTPIDGGETELHGLCRNGDTFKVPASVKYQENNNIFIEVIKLNDKNAIPNLSSRACGSANSLKGFLFIIEMNEKFDLDEDHYVGKNGKDLGDYAAFTKIKLAGKIDPYLITLEELMNGTASTHTINVNAIYDIDNLIENGDKTRRQVYADIGFK